MISAIAIPTPRRRGPLAGYPVRSWIRFGIVLLFVLLLFVLFFAVEQPIRSGTLDARLGADSETYYAVANLLHGGGASEVTFLSFGGNLIGPIIMTAGLQSPLLIMAVNLAIFLFSIQACAPLPLSRTRLVLLLACNATTWVSIVTVNKEIFALSASLLLCRYIYTARKSRWLLALICVMGIMARWQQVMISLLFVYFWREGSIYRRRPWLGPTLLIAFITFLYPIVVRLTLLDLSFASNLAEGGGTIVFLNTLQSDFFYPLVLVPKALMALFDRVLTPTYWFTMYSSQNFTDYANQYVIHLHSFATFGVWLAAFAKGRLTLRRPVFYFAALYLAITSANLFIQPRYQYPLYVLLCFDLALNEKTSGTLLMPLPFRRIFGIRIRTTPPPALLKQRGSV